MECNGLGAFTQLVKGTRIIEFITYCKQYHDFYRLDAQFLALSYRLFLNPGAFTPVQFKSTFQTTFYARMLRKCLITLPIASC